MKNSLKRSVWISICFCTLVLTGVAEFGHAQEVTGPHRVKWLRVGTLHNWYSNAGAEVEYGRRGRAAAESQDQADQLNWEAQFPLQDRACSKGLWIGTTNYDDPVDGKNYPFKVVQAGPRFANTLTNFMPEIFKMVGKSPHPSVVVDGLSASDNIVNDVVDEYDESMKADRMIVNKLHSSIGVTVTRKIYAFSQQYHDNYFIYDYVFKNTGILDLNGTTVEKTLPGVFFFFSYRYAPGFEGGMRSFVGSGNVSWGKNTVNDVVGQNPNAADFQFRAFYSYYGPHSGSPGYESDWGDPNHNQADHLGAPAFLGVVTIHADKSPGDPGDDLSQPFSTQYLGSDQNINSVIDSYNRDAMVQQYTLMSAGHPEKTHAQEVGSEFADRWGGDGGGYSQSIAFGPYTLDPGDSVHIVLAEAVAGLRREKSTEVGTKWFSNTAPFVLPSGTTTTDRHEYKKAWVWTAKDSLFAAFERAIENYNNNFAIPEPPPAPKDFTVTSGGNRIILTWTDNAVSSPYFDGYQIYRAIGRPDTLYDKIFSCDKSNYVHSFDDTSASRGFDYYYYIQTKDDGARNSVHPGVPLVSSRFYTMTNQAAQLQREAEDNLSEIRVVPNPFNIRASSLQFGSTTPDRIAFYGLPPECIIKIYTERGDLIETIEHLDGSGDELWDSVTSSRQIVVSGLYIAYFEVTKDFNDPQTGKRLFNKGDNTFRKFIIIR